MTSRQLRRALLTGVSAAALFAAAPSVAGTPAQFSAQFYAALAGVQRNAGTLTGARPPGLGPTQSAQSLANIATLSRRLAQAAATQSAAAAAAFANPSSRVPDGLVAGGLQLAPNPTLATQFGASAPTQSAAGGRTTVSVNQTAEQALLTWRTFNVGAHTTLRFNQPDQSAVVLNQVADPAANPSTILGQIGANGRVYILNPNGILFGAGSQVNVGGLVASSGSLNPTYGSTAAFLTGSTGGAFGLYGAVVGLSASSTQGTLEPTFVGATAPITVAAGASIATPPSPTPTLGGGLVLLHGGTVTNAGSIATPSGQTILAAGEGLLLQAGFGTNGNATSTVFGTEAGVTNGGAVTNSGVVVAALGDATLVGHAVSQAGVLLTTTSVGATEQGTIHLLTDKSDTTALVTLAPGSLTLIAPDAKAETALDATRTSQITTSATNDVARQSAVSLLNDDTTMSDRRDLSLVQITTGGAVDFGAGSLTMAQGGQVNVDSQTRALIESGASIDVSGVGTAVVPQSLNVVTFRIETPNLSDNPVSRGAQGLSLGTVDVDTRDLLSATGPYAGIDYTEGGALLVPASVAQGNAHGIDEWLSVGGTVTLSSHVIAAQTGSSINLAGGAITYAAGAVPQRYLIGADGRDYDVNTAPESIPYVGIYNGFDDPHPRWSVTEVYNNPLVTPSSVNEPGYVVGRDGGTLVIAALPITGKNAAGNTVIRQQAAVLLDGSILAGVVTGAFQTAARASGVTDGYSQPQTAVPLAGSITIGPPGFGQQVFSTLSNDVVVGSGNTLADSVSLTSTLSAADTSSIALDAAALTAGGLGGLTIETSGSVAVVADVSLVPGGHVSLTGSRINVSSVITARGGGVSIVDALAPEVAVTNKPGTSGVTLSPTATIDVRGEFSNGLVDGFNAPALAFLNGGTVALTAMQVTLSPGSLIDVSAGYGIRANAVRSGGAGGSVSVLGDFENVLTADVGPTVSLGGTIRGYGVTGGGTLTVQSDRVQIGGTAAGLPRGTLVLDPALFDTGFQSYVVAAGRTLSVADDTTVAPVVPTLLATGGAPLAPTGSDPLQALQLTLLPLYTQNPRTAQLTQRPGASLTLTADTGVNVATQAPSVPLPVLVGAITVGPGSQIVVDPLKTISIVSNNQLTVEGTLTAPGGTVALLDPRADEGGATAVSGYLPGLSIWLGAASRIDVAGTGATALDAAGRAYGLATAGGTVEIGAPDIAFGQTLADPTDAAIIARPGSVIDASGTAIQVALLVDATPTELFASGVANSSQTVTDATAGGTIELNSSIGLFMDGAIHAESGGAGAPGGALSFALQTGSASLPPNVAPTHVANLTVEQTYTAGLPVGITLGRPVPRQSLLTGRIGVDQIAAGGFDTVALDTLAKASSDSTSGSNVAAASGGLIEFQGAVSLAVGSALTIAASDVADTTRTASVVLAAPSVTIVGGAAPGEQAAKPLNNSITVTADLLQLSGGIEFGQTATLALASKVENGNTVTPTAIEQDYGFGTVNLVSAGDIRIGVGTLETAGNVSLTAAQIFPDAPLAAQGAVIEAGVASYQPSLANTYSPNGVISIHSNGPTPPVPGSIAGSLSLIAATIDQGGVIRAPEGTISLGNAVAIAGKGSGYPTLVRFEPGSITSVSLDGAQVPFGGTPDGAVYTLPTGQNVVNSPTASASTGNIAPQINVASVVVDLLPSSTLDISGGGELLGAGFINAGRGGSVDVLTNPLISYNAATRTISTPSLSADPVYAIVPGYVGAYAPASTAGSAVPNGEQITIGSGIPGLAAGVYTLLPATYALLPGAFRVQLGATENRTVPPVVDLPAGLVSASGTLSVANTGFVAPLPVAVLLSPGDVTRQLAAYDEESYSQFVVAQATQTGLPRLPIAADAGALNLTFPNAPSTHVAQLVSAGTLDGTPAAGGYGDTLTIGSQLTAALPIEIVGANPVPAKGFVTVGADAIDALAAQTVNVQAPDVAVRSGATLAAGQIQVLDASTITIEPGATLTTIGRTVSAYVNPYSPTFAVVQAGGPDAADVLQGITLSGTNANISIAAGSGLLTQGSITADSGGGALSIDPAAVVGARFLSLIANDVDIGDPAAIAAAQQAGTLPNGLVLSQQVLNTLLAGNPTLGTPALQSLSLTANSRVNLYGSVTLSTLGASGGSGLQSLQLSTPAIYGAGGPGDTATIGTGTLYLSGLVTQLTAATTVTAATYAATPPGAPIAGGPGFGRGTLDIVASDIVFGTAPDSVPHPPIAADRLIEGFAAVNLTATDRITADNLGAVDVYAQPGTIYGGPGVGGTLTLTTPLLTAGPGTTLGLVAGGALSLASSGGVSASGPTGYGGQVTIAADSVSLDSAVVLPGGRLDVTATGGIALGAAGTIDVSAGNATFFDQVRGIPGGSATLESAGGSVTAAPGSMIALGSAGSDAGLLQVTAMAGTVDLAGTIGGAGGALNGRIGAGGTIDVRAGTLTDVNALDAGLNAGGVDGARTLEIGSGDVTLTGSIVADTIDISADAGSLTLAGQLDASGDGPGRVSLAAHDGLTVAAGSTVDVHETALHTDSYGGVIAAENTGSVSLTSVTDTVAIAGGVAIDAGSPDGVARGVLTLNAPRVGATDIAVSAAAPVTLTGVAAADVVGWRSYTAGRQIGTTIAAGTVEVAQADFDKIDAADTAPFMAAVDASGALAARLTGLAGTTVNLRPGVEVDTTGTLVVGDTDLHTFRYGGQPGALRLRAAGDLVFNGSLTDGFGTVPQSGKGNPDDQGWIVFDGTSEPFNQTIVVPEAFGGKLILDAGTTLTTNAPGGLNYAVPVAAGATLSAGVVIPQSVVIDASGGPYVFMSQATATSAILDGHGNTVFARGALIPAGTVLRNGDTLSAGALLPFQVVTKTSMVWAAGESLAALGGTVTLGDTVTLEGGAVLPAGSSFMFDPASTQSTVRFVDGSTTAVDLRAPNKAGQGLIYATAPLLSGPSWSYDLVSGANLASANGAGVQAASTLDGGGNTVLADTHYTTPYLGLQGTFVGPQGLATGGATPSFSVIRTGTGGITIASGGSFTEDSLFGVYTAGAATAVPAAYQPARANDADGYASVLGRSTAPGGADYDQLIAASAYNYPDGGGDLSLHTQGDIVGATTSSEGNGAPTTASTYVTDWLLQQGVQGLSGIADQPTAWGINFGTYVDTNTAGGLAARPTLIGFTGIGTMGGGNLSVVAGGGAGDVAGTGFMPATAPSTPDALVLAVGGSGVVTSVTTNGAAVTGGTVTETGGGALSLRVAGAITDGLITDIRGPITIAAGAIGQAGPFGTPARIDPRPVNPFAPSIAGNEDPLDLAPGDSQVRVSTLGDLDVRFDDPGLVPSEIENGFIDTPTQGALVKAPAIATTNFTLWTAATSVELTSAGGNVTPAYYGDPTNSFSKTSPAGFTESATIGGLGFVPPAMDVVAASGNILIGSPLDGFNDGSISFELAPSAHGNLDLLAQGSIEDNGGVVAVSGSGYGPNDVANPFKPHFDFVAGLREQLILGDVSSDNKTAPNGGGSGLLAFESDTASAAGHAADGVPERVYAVAGDIFGLELGEQIYLGTAAIAPTTLEIASTSAVVRAGQDIVDLGQQMVTFGSFNGTIGGSLFLNRSASDVSVLSAGRDILDSSVTIAGGGVLSVEAGRNLDQANASTGVFGNLVSIGPVYSVNPLNPDTGAAIAVTVGAGAAGPDFPALEAAYLDPNAIAVPGIDLGSGANADRVAADYLPQLVTFLQTTYGYGGDQTGARAFLDTLSGEQKDVFLRQVYFDELVASGREETDPTSVRSGSYARGKQAISILFPAGQTYGGDYTAFSAVNRGTIADAGIATNFGGSIQLLVPGGQILLGEGTTIPGPGTGLITRGSGDIDGYSSGSILLDLSRVFTTFGGSVALWSSGGDISAGNGAQSTLLFAPPSINYDPFGGISIAPSVPSSGAGIATLAPIPGVPAGNVDLIAPQGTIDAGEAGIRVSGNLNLAALVVANAANITVQGKTTGAPTVAVANVGALSAAAAAAGAAVNEAQQTAQRQSSAKPQNAGSIITVEVVGNGG